MSIRVVLADDQTLVRAGFRSIIDSAPDMTVVGEATNGNEAIALASSARADVVLMDIRMPELDGIEATRAITNDESLAGVQVVILTTFEQDDLIIDALRAGASGFLGKGVEPQDLLNAIRTIADGSALLSPQATKSVIARLLAQPHADHHHDQALGQLTDREREVTALVAQGFSNDAIAEQLYMSPLTAKTHVNRAMMKVGARDRAQLVVFAYQSGLVVINP